MKSKMACRLNKNLNIKKTVLCHLVVYIYSECNGNKKKMSMYTGKKLYEKKLHATVKNA